MAEVYTRLLETAILPTGDRILGSGFMSAVRQVREEDRMTENQLTDLQDHRLDTLLGHALRSSEYYKRLGIRPDADQDPRSLLAQFPILTKQRIRAHSDEILTRTKDKVIAQSSSGSSGVQTTIYLSRRELDYPRARQTRWWEWADYRLGTPVLQTGITPGRGLVKRTKDLLLRTQYVSAFALSRTAIQAELLRARRNGVRHLFGYASSLFVFAEVARESGMDITFDSAVAWGDKVFPHYRREIESTFQTRLFETYGCAEGLMIASQKDMDHLYIMTPGIVLELLDDDGQPVADGQMGHVVVTGLTNLSFPLIRYRLGDLAIKLPRSQYPQQRSFAYPLLQKVIGRDTDLVVTPSGKKLVVHTFTGVFEHFPEIYQFRVRQTDTAGIFIDYVPGKEFSSSVLDAIREQLITHIQEPFQIVFEKVDTIHPTPSGKPQIVQSSVR